MAETRTVDWYLSRAPSDAEWARRAVAPYLHLSPEERLRALAALNGWMDSILAGRVPEREDGEYPFAMHWRDPSLGRPR